MCLFFHPLETQAFMPEGVIVEVKTRPVWEALPGFGESSNGLVGDYLQ